MNSKNLGLKGEQLAKKLLQNKGYRFLAQNFRTRYGEIDLVFQEAGCIIFVEVKSRTTFDQGLPEEAVNNRKLQHIAKAAAYYLQSHQLEDLPARIDVVSVDCRLTPPLLTHLTNVTG